MNHFTNDNPETVRPRKLYGFHIHQGDEWRYQNHQTRSMREIIEQLDRQQPAPRNVKSDLDARHDAMLRALLIYC